MVRTSLPGWHLLSDAWLALLRRIDVDLTATVVELGPGRASKLAPALAWCGFRGTFYVVDASPVACAAAADFCRRLLPEAQVIEVPYAIAAAPLHLPRGVQLIAGNHVLDDWALGATLSVSEYRALYDRLDERSVARVARFWQRAWRADAVDAAVAQVRIEAGRLLDLGAGAVALNHYESWVHAHFGLRQADDAGRACLHAIQSTYGCERMHAMHSASDGPASDGPAVEWFVSRPARGAPTDLTPPTLSRERTEPHSTNPVRAGGGR